MGHSFSLMMGRHLYREKKDVTSSLSPKEVTTLKDRHSRILALFPYWEWVNTISSRMSYSTSEIISWVQATVLVCLPQRVQLMCIQIRYFNQTVEPFGLWEARSFRDEGHQTGPAPTSFLTLKGCISLAMRLNQFQRKPCSKSFFY